MKKVNLKLILVIIWMIIIFAFSAQKGTESSNTSGSFTMFVINILTGGNANLKETTIKMLEAIIRKMAHYSIYTVGGVLIMNYAYSTNQNIKNKTIYSILFGGGYACTDELHQFFVEGRSARLFDVGIDTLGVITGVLIYIAIKKVTKKKINKILKEKEY